MSLQPRFSLARVLVCCGAAWLGAAGPLEPATAGAPAASGDSVQIFVQPGAHLGPILSLIRLARHSLRLELYELTNRTVIQELSRSRQRGVDVRVLLEEHPFGGDRYAGLAYSALQQAGVPVRWANEQAFRYTHEKAMEVDDRIAGIFTSNLTSSGIYSNREFLAIDRSSADARTLDSLFQADWTRRRPHVSDPRLAISPYDARRRLTSLVDGARHSLDLYVEEIADPSMESHLTRAARRGVRVRLITSQTSADVGALERSGVAMTIMPRPYVHAKAIVADGGRLFVGSENLSTTSLDQNREVGIVLNDPSAAGVVERTFGADWTGNRPQRGPPPTSTATLQVRVTVDPSSVTRGQLLTIRASTSPDASCTVKVTYPDGYVSRAGSLSTVETANASGTVSWSWHVGSTVRGTSTASVTCMLNGATATGSATFEIR